VSDAICDLVAAARGGDRRAFGSLVELHWGMLVRIARSVVGDADAEDVVQEALVSAWRKLGDLSDATRFPSWVTRIVFRRGLRRARRRRPEVALEALADPASDSDPSADVWVWQVLGRLAPRQRAVLHMTVIEGMSDSEIATSLGISASSVRVHRMRAREQVGKLMEGERTHAWA